MSTDSRSKEELQLYKDVEKCLCASTEDFKVRIGKVFTELLQNFDERVVDNIWEFIDEHKVYDEERMIERIYYYFMEDPENIKYYQLRQMACRDYQKQIEKMITDDIIKTGIEKQLRDHLPTKNYKHVPCEYEYDWCSAIMTFIYDNVEAFLESDNFNGAFKALLDDIQTKKHRLIHWFESDLASVKLRKIHNSKQLEQIGKLKIRVLELEEEVENLKKELASKE